MKRLNKMSISLMLIFSIIFGYIAPIAPVFADATTILYERSGGTRLDQIATLIDDNTYVDKKYSAYSVRTTSPKVIVYNYDTTVEKTCTGNDTAFPFVGNENKCFLKTNQDFSEAYYCIELPEGNGTYNNIATVLYLDALRYYGVSYDVKLNIKQIRKVGAAKSDFRILKGKKETGSEADKYNLSTYTADFNPSIAVGTADGVKTEVDVEYVILDKRGNEAKISGIFGATDIDLNQGIFIDDYNVNRSNAYMLREFEDVLYKNVSNGTYMYTLTEDGTTDRNAYLLMDEISKVELTATYESKGAVLGLAFINNVNNLNYYNKLIVTSEIDHGVTKVNGALGTESSHSISKNTTNGQNDTNTVNFKPAEGYKVSTITVDGEPKTTSDCTLANGVYTYTFTDTNINTDIEHHVIITTELKDTSVLVKHVNEAGTEIASRDTYTGKVFDKYATSPKSIPNYELKTTPSNAKGTMTENQIVVTYVYKLKDAKVTVKHLEVGTNKELAPTETINGKIGDPYTTQPKTIGDYKLVVTPVNARGTMDDENTDVIYYYTLKDATVTVNYLDEDGKQIADSVPKDGKVGDDYTSEQKEIDGYEIKTVPDNAKGKMKEEPTIVNYIYKLKPAKVIVKYVDTKGKEIADGTTIDGKFFDKYETESKDIPNYKLITVPENATGTMDKAETTVTYVYDLKESTVVVNYLDDNGKKIATTETKKGKVTEEYTTEQKNIDGYTIKTKPDNAKGVFTEKEIVVNYIYSKNPAPVKELPKTGNFNSIITVAAITMVTLFGATMAIKIKKLKDLK